MLMPFPKPQVLTVPLGLLLLLLPLVTLGMGKAPGAEATVLLLDGDGNSLLDRESLLGPQALSAGDSVSQTIVAMNLTTRPVTLWIRRNDSLLWSDDGGAQLRVVREHGRTLFDGPAYRAAASDIPIPLPGGGAVRFSLGIGVPPSMDTRLQGAGVEIDFHFLTSDDAPW